MEEKKRSYIPAAGHDWLLPLYDPLQRWLLREEPVKRRLIEQATVEPGQQILDIGCGTGTLTISIKRLHPQARVVGLDPDSKALAIAQRKAQRAEVAIQFDRGFSDGLPYPSASFDRVFSSFMLHHLTREEKLATLHEVQRVLKPSGSLHVLDFGKPRGHVGSVLARLLHRGQHLRDNIEGRIPTLMSDAGFAHPEEVAHRATIVGSISYYRSVKPLAESGEGAAFYEGGPVKPPSG